MKVNKIAEGEAKELTKGVLPVNKPRGMSSFQLVRILRRLLGVRKIGHAGTLDPFADGVMIMLIGREYTRLSDRFLAEDKEYRGRVKLGVTTDTFDCEGTVLKSSDFIPREDEIRQALRSFQGEIDQLPPMYSAKKINGKKLYELARKGQTVERAPVKIRIETTLIAYSYPFIDLHVKCSKGTYIRSVAHDLGELLGCGGHLLSLTRVRSGSIHLNDCFEGTMLESDPMAPSLIKDNLFDIERLPCLSPAP